MDIVIGIIRAVLMLGFIGLVIFLLAVLFIVVFGIGTGIDRRMQE
jgi:hypothetical protein